jgi:ankyrin repeat protein
MGLSILPEDIIGHITTYFDVEEMSNAGAACRELYFACYTTAHHTFTKAFGAPPEPSMSRARVFHTNGRIASTDDASMRDMLLWCCIRGYTTMIKRLNKRATRLALPAFLETRSGIAGLTPLLLAVEHNRLAVVKMLLDLVSTQEC